MAPLATASVRRESPATSSHSQTSLSLSARPSLRRSPSPRNVTRVPSALADPDITRVDADHAALNRLFDDLTFGRMLRERALAAARR